MNKTKAMLISVGGTNQPIIKAINVHNPEFVSFLVSQKTSSNAIEIANTLKDAGVTFHYEQTITEIPDDLLICYAAAEKSVEKILKRGYKTDEAVVDYTGGTKNMSVAISLASVKHGFMYSYVGGKERTKDGKGIVVDGHEELYQSVNPWDFLAIEEKDRIRTLFNTYQFKAAREIADFVVLKTTKFKSLFRNLGLIIDGFYRWDLFCHSDALRMFELAKIEDEYEYEWVKSFAHEVFASMKILSELVKETGKPSRLMICDLYANAERRFKEGKIDDAILRLYRIVEMIAQMKLIENYGIDVSDVKEDKIPESIRGSFSTKYRDTEDKKIKLSQNAAYLLLKELGDEIGKVFIDNEKKFKKIQQSRNYSYLAHGFQSSSEKTYQSLRDFIISLKLFESEDVLSFPKL